MRHAAAVLLSSLACAVLATMPLPAQQEAPGQQAAEKKPPTPKEKARELLEATVQTATGAKPEVAAFALMYVAENYDGFDHAKAVEYLRQAFAVTASIPPGEHDWKARVQADIAASAAKLSLTDAIEMVKQIQPAGPAGDGDPRQSAINAIVSRLIEKKDPDGAIELLNSLGSTGRYPFRAAERIFTALPPDDPRREALFGYATSAYTLRPGDGFADLLAKHWKELPRAQAESAVRAIVENVLNEKGEPAANYASTLSSSKGTVTFTDPQNLKLFSLMYILREVDPKRAADLLDSRGELKAAVARFPLGRESLGNEVSWSTSSGSGPLNAPQQALNGLADSRVQASAQALADADDKDVSAEVSKGRAAKALEIAKTIPLPDRKAAALARIAKSVTKSDPGMAKTILSECIETIKDVKDVRARQAVWDDVVLAAHRAGEDKLAWEAVDHSLADAMELYKIDTDADQPNGALREQWPSTNAYRHSVIAATQAFGTDATPLLERVTDPDLAVFARLEMAATLLGNPRANWTTSVSRSKK